MSMAEIHPVDAMRIKETVERNREMARLAAELEKYRHIAAIWGEHKRGCGHPCTCGLAAALAKPSQSDAKGNV